MSFVTPNMSLVVPEINDSNYPDSVESSLNTLDSHTHAAGSGLQIPTAGITDLAVTSSKLASNAVTTAKITDINVTRAKLAAVGEQSGAQVSMAVFTTASATVVDVTNVTLSITTTGRPVVVSLFNNSLDVSCATASIALGSPLFTLNRGSTVLASAPIKAGTTPSISVMVVDSPAAGTYTYKMQVAAGGSGGNSLDITGMKIVAYEL